MHDNEEILKKVMEKRTSVKDPAVSLFEKQDIAKFYNDKELLEKVKELLDVSKRINLNRMQDALGLEKTIFNKKVFEWAKDFGFTIDGDYLIVNDNSLTELTNILELKFKEWEEKESSKNDKKD